MARKGPYMISNNTNAKMMRNVVIALLPIIIFTFYKNGFIPYMAGKTNVILMFYPLIFVMIASISTFLFEIIYVRMFLRDKYSNLKDYIKDSYSIIPGLFLGLILPINTPIPILIFGSFMASIVGKMLFGGFGKNIFNPALVGNIFIMATYAMVISNNGGYLNSYEVDAVASATPLSNASMVTGIGTYDTLVAPYGSLWDFFVGTIPGAIGETSALLCMIGFIYLILTKTIKWRIPVFYVGTVFFMIMMIGIFNGIGLWYPVFAVLSGGLMFGAVFMATDPVTSPTTGLGQIIYGVCLGLLTVIFRYLTPFPEGVLTSILTMNMLVFIIDRMSTKLVFNKQRRILIFTAIFGVIIATIFNIYGKYDVGDVEKNSDFKVISSEVVNNNTEYVVVQKGYEGDIKAKIVINYGKIISYELLDKKDSYYEMITNSNYIDKLINEQNNLSEVDTVSGATFTSNALKKMFINTLEDYGDRYE